MCRFLWQGFGRPAEGQSALGRKPAEAGGHSRARGQGADLGGGAGLRHGRSRQSLDNGFPHSAAGVNDQVDQ